MWASRLGVGYAEGVEGEVEEVEVEGEVEKEKNFPHVRKHR